MAKVCRLLLETEEEQAAFIAAYCNRVTVPTNRLRKIFETVYNAYTLKINTLSMFGEITKSRARQLVRCYAPNVRLLNARRGSYICRKKLICPFCRFRLMRDLLSDDEFTIDDRVLVIRRHVDCSLDEVERETKMLSGKLERVLKAADLPFYVRLQSMNVENVDGVDRIRVTQAVVSRYAPKKVPQGWRVHETTWEKVITQVYSYSWRNIDGDDALIAFLASVSRFRTVERARRDCL